MCFDSLWPVQDPRGVKSAFQLAKNVSTQSVFRNLISDRPPSDLPNIMIGAIKHDDFGLLELLVHGGANSNGTDADGKTPLSVASELGRANAVALLLQNGADCDLKDSDGKTAAELASTVDVKALLNMYHKQGASDKAKEDVRQELIARLHAAAKEIGFDMEQDSGMGEGHSDKYDASELEMGLPPDAGAVVDHCKHSESREGGGRDGTVMSNN